MRTVRNSSRLRGGGVCLGRGVYLVPGGVPGSGGGGCTWPGVYLVWGVCLPRGNVPALGVYLDQGVYLVPGEYLVLGGVPVRGVYLLGGWEGVPAQLLPPVNRMTDRCKNITFTTSLRMVKINQIEVGDYISVD